MTTIRIKIDAMVPMNAVLDAVVKKPGVLACVDEGEFVVRIDVDDLKLSEFTDWMESCMRYGTLQ